MSMEIKVPELPESITEATLVNWHKQVGEPVNRDENLVDLETDKVVLEVPAPTSGTLKEIKIADGETVTAGQVIALLEEGEVAPAPKSASETPKDKTSSDKSDAAAQQNAKAGPVTGERENAADMPLSPSVRRLVDEHGLDPSKINASGRDGRLTKGDVLSFLERSGGESGKKPADRPSSVVPAGSRSERHVPMSRIRKRIAERMTESQSNTVMLTSFNEVDLGAVIDIRKRYREQFEKQHGVRLGFMSFFVRAAVKALKAYPVVNASIEGEDIVYHDYWDIGVAVSTDRGLVVPILRDADQLPFGEIESQIVDYATKARKGGLTIEEITGGTFTITNGGVFGSLLSTPIINPPQSAILGMHKIQERPMVVDGQVQARPMMYIALTYDHRIIDGRDAVLFLVAIKEALEDPARLLLDI